MEIRNFLRKEVEIPEIGEVALFKKYGEVKGTANIQSDYVQTVQLNTTKGYIIYLNFISEKNDNANVEIWDDNCK